MREIHADVARWLEEGRRVALAQVTKTWGSSPRAAGAVMAVSDDGRIAGSVSGGCIESSVICSALECIEQSGGRMERFIASTARAHEVGLSCGGSIEVLVSPLDAGLFRAEERLIARDSEYVRVSVVESGQAPADDFGDAATSAAPEGSAAGGGAASAEEPKRAGAFELEADAGHRASSSEVGVAFLIAYADDAEAALGLSTAADIDADGTPAAAPGTHLVDVPGDEPVCAIVPDGCAWPDGLVSAVAREVAEMPLTQDTGHVHRDGIDWFFSRCHAKPQLICIGGVHIAIHLAAIAHTLGYRTVVIDPRGVFATSERFAGVDELVHDWPQRAFDRIPVSAQTAVCALTHDPKIDVPALARALDSRAFYIGSLGRVTTQLSRYRQLSELGYPDESIARIFGPIGLDLKGRDPAEIALAIMAEITAVRHGGKFKMATMLESARSVMGQDPAAVAPLSTPACGRV
ncbi:MAG: XdhC family protein [Coriobacteriales bacterium]|jgi:xanthine dehydrogenase accessory factor